jgi:hypothetical protein
MVSKRLKIALAPFDSAALNVNTARVAAGAAATRVSCWDR